jgi:hypothetical protein
MIGGKAPLNCRIPSQAFPLHQELLRMIGGAAYHAQMHGLAKMPPCDVWACWMRMTKGTARPYFTIRHISCVDRAVFASQTIAIPQVNYIFFVVTNLSFSLKL